MPYGSDKAHRKPPGLSRDRPAPREDTCPECGTRRRELVVAVGRFYCPSCEVAGEGPNDGPPTTLF